MRRASLEELAGAGLDLLVVGGGIVGCGIARDAALRRLRVGVIDREDFGAGTTSRSTRLIHGGLRYLELLDFGLVRSDMRERETLLRIAPHLVRPLPFLVPMYGWPAWKRDRLRIGMLLYDVLSYDKSLPQHRFHSRAETLRAEPSLDPRGLRGAARYYDAQVEFPERLALANAIDAAEHGALLRNHTAAERFVREDGRVIGVEARDVRTDRRAVIRARLTINATGPWLDRSLAGLEEGRAPLLRTTKGAHLVMPALSRNAILLVARSDERVFFVVPWFGYSLVGTTDTDFRGDPATARAEPPDVDYLLRETTRTFPSAAGAPIYYGMAGVRALVRKEGVTEGRVSRKHAIRDHGSVGGPEGLVSVLGGKITAYRGIAEEATDVATGRLGWGGPSRTAESPLPGGDAPPDEVVARLWPRAKELGLAERQARHLVDLYGSRARDVLVIAENDPSLAFPLCGHGPAAIKAQVTHAARNEGAATLADVLLRRVPVGLASCLALDCLETAAEVLGHELGWDGARRREEIVAYEDLVTERYQAPTVARAGAALAEAR
jgi:glycerol-3-phosphate dehydrogenase